MIVVIVARSLSGAHLWCQSRSFPQDSFFYIEIGIKSPLPPCQHAGDAGEAGRLEESHQHPDDDYMQLPSFARLPLTQPDNDQEVRVALLPSCFCSHWNEKGEDGDASHGHGKHPLAPIHLGHPPSRHLGQQLDRKIFRGARTWKTM